MIVVGGLLASFILGGFVLALRAGVPMVQLIQIAFLANLLLAVIALLTVVGRALGL